MPKVEISEKGVVIKKAGSGFEVKDIGVITMPAVTSSYSGPVSITAPLAIGRALSGSSGGALLQISGTAGRAGQCYIHLFATSSVSSSAVAAPGPDGASGLADIPPMGSVFLWTDGSNLFMKTSAASTVYRLSSSAL